MTDETELAPEIALLWNAQKVTRRGPKPTLTIDDIVNAAVAIADAEGLDAVSMARVAAHLGNSTMALYRHVKSKRDLLMLMSDCAIEEPPEFPADGDWRSNLEHWARSVMSAFGKHTWFATIPVTGPPFGPRNLKWFDRALSALGETALSEPEKTGIVMALMTYVRGGYKLHAELEAGFVENPAAFSRQYHTVLSRLVDPRDYPALSKVIAAGVFDADTLWEESEHGMDSDFDMGLQIFLDGIAVYLDRRDNPS
jgi:AcrR family transcriptional regulator